MQGGHSPPTRIMIVEDSAFIAMGMESILLHAGHDVVGLATNATEAIQLAAKSRPDLALVDLQLADGLTGLEIARRLQQDHSIPTLFCTADSALIFEDDCGCGCLGKPFTEQQLQQAVEAALRLLRDGIMPDVLPSWLRLWPLRRS